MATRKLIETGLRLIAVAPGGPPRHVTADRQTTLCGVRVEGDWYAGDAGEFGSESDCGKCYTALKGE